MWKVIIGVTQKCQSVVLAACCVMKSRDTTHSVRMRSARFEAVCKLQEAFPGLGKEGSRKGGPEETFALVCPYDGIGGARVACELLGIVPALYLSIEDDEDCVAVVKRAWPEAVLIEKVEQVTENDLRSIFRMYPKITTALILGVPPSQPFSG